MIRVVVEEASGLLAGAIGEGPTTGSFGGVSHQFRSPAGRLEPLLREDPLLGDQLLGGVVHDR